MTQRSSSRLLRRGSLLGRSEPHSLLPSLRGVGEGLGMVPLSRSDRDGEALRRGESIGVPSEAMRTHGYAAVRHASRCVACHKRHHWRVPLRIRAFSLGHSMGLCASPFPTPDAVTILCHLSKEGLPCARDSLLASMSTISAP
jgi:hypothetical protein